MRLQTQNEVSLPNLNQKSTSDTPNIPIGGYLTLERIQLQEPSRAFNMRLAEKHRSVAGTISPEAFVPDVHSEYWSLP